MSALGRMRFPRLSSHVWSHWPRFVNETIFSTVATGDASRFVDESLARAKGESSLLIFHVLSTGALCIRVSVPPESRGACRWPVVEETSTQRYAGIY